MPRTIAEVATYLFAASLLLSATACSDEPLETTDGGATGMDASRDAAMDAREETRADAGPSARWIATKTTLDVWWPRSAIDPQSPGSQGLDPGRGLVELYALVRAVGGCEAPASNISIKVCGISLPTFTNDLDCSAYALTIADEAWDRASMPWFDARSAEDVDAGSATPQVARVLLGIDLLQAPDVGRWPTRTQDVACSSGVGAACFPDHDGDTFAGITAQLRNDSSSYLGPHDDGRCTTTGQPYKLRGMRTEEDLGAGAGIGHGVSATGLHLGVGARLVAPSDAACSFAATSVHLRASECAVDPSSLDTSAFPPDPRIASKDYSCTTAEAIFVDASLPHLEVLAAGETPGETMNSVGWLLAGRDIDRSPSEGTRVRSLELNVDAIDAGGDGQPSCAQVRAAFANE